MNATDILATIDLISQELSANVTRRRDEAAAAQKSQALEESEERFRRLTELTLEGVMLHDTGVLINGNPEFFRNVGYRREELIGRYVLDFLPAPHWREIVMSHARQGFERPFEVQAQRKDGSVFPVEITGRPTLLKGHKVRVATIRDITERREAEQQAQRLVLEQAARREAEEQQAKMAFLAEASRVLGTSFDYATTISSSCGCRSPHSRTGAWSMSWRRMATSCASATRTAIPRGRSSSSSARTTSRRASATTSRHRGAAHRHVAVRRRGAARRDRRVRDG